MDKNRIELKIGDITKIKVDAIVNAANSRLAGGGGVDGAIHLAAGPSLHKECMRIGGCPAGEAVITGAGKIPVKNIIHTVGPIWRGGNKNEPELLKNAYWNSLLLAVENNIKTISFPNISTGIYGFPKKEAADIAVTTVCNFLKDNLFVEKVIFVCFDNDNYKLYKKKLDDIK